MSFGAPLQTVSSAALTAAHERVSAFDRNEVLNKFRSAFHHGQRKASLLCADSLIARGIPPAFWHDHRSRTDYSPEQRFDLLAHDVRWIRATYPEQARTQRYRRYGLMLAGAERDFWRELEFAFYGGQRPVWKIVASLGLDVRQQTDCHRLRSAPVARRLQAITDKREQVFKVLSADVQTIRRTTAFTDDDAKALLLRRHQLWMCGQMSDGPTETALRYLQMTGQIISRQLAAKHLQKVAAIMRGIEMSSQPKSR